MAHTTVSSKYQVVIPREVRREMGLKTGQRLQIVARGGLITLVPERSLASLRGFLAGARTGKVREKKDRI